MGAIRKQIITTVIIMILTAVVLYVGVMYVVWKRQQPITEQPTEKKKEYAKPETYEETFEDPIDPNINPLKHESIYEKIGSIAEGVTAPKQVPIGYKLVSVESEGVKIDPIINEKYTGAFRITYVKGETKFTYSRGIGDFGGLGKGEEVQFQNGSRGYCWVTSSGQNILWFGGTSNESLTLVSYQLDKRELTEIANLFLGE